MPELGNKHECFSCGAKFYDLGKPAPICPKCGANQKDARKQEATAEAVVRRRKRDEPVDLPEDDAVSASAEDDFGDDELDRPDGADEDDAGEDFDDE